MPAQLESCATDQQRPRKKRAQVGRIGTRTTAPGWHLISNRRVGRGEKGREEECRVGREFDSLTGDGATPPWRSTPIRFSSSRSPSLAGMEAFRTIASRVGSSTGHSPSAFRTIASRVGSSTGHSPSGTLLGAARAMCAAALYGVDCGVALRPDFPIIIAAPKRRALAETTTATAPLVIPDSSASRRLATTDGSATLASPFASSCDGTADCASQAGIGRKPMLLLLTAGTSVPASSSSSSSSSSSTALGVSPAWGRRSPSHSWGGIFCTDKMLLGASSSWAQQLFVPIWYSTSSGGAYRKAASRNREREAPVIYAVGMFGDINEPKWTPLEFAKANVPLQTVKLVGDKVDKEYTVLTEVAKGWFVSLPLLIEKLKIHGYSFYNPVSISQLMVDKYGQFVIPDGTLLQKTNKRHASNDYFSSASVFEEIIKHSCIDIIPPDSYNDFLMKLRSKEEPHGYYMCVHPTFLPLPSYSQAYLDIYDHVKENLTGHQAREILSCLQITAGLWETIMEGNVLLLAWFHDPLNVRRNQDVERYNFGNPKHLFVYLRHVHSHLLVYIKLFGKYTKDEARVVVDSKFSEVMSKLCWKLWKGQFLVDIQSEAYFCKEGSACCPTPGFCLRRKIRLTLKESRDRKQAAKDQQARHQQAKD